MNRSPGQRSRWLPRLPGAVWLPALLLLVLALAPLPLQADRISELTETSVAAQAARFFTFRDPSLRYALVGSILLGITCGLLGSFIVVRKMALMGDALSHAVLPGVAAGFLWNVDRDPVAIFIGATIAGLAGSALVSAIRNTTRIKEDSALGIVLATFFAVGICLLTMIQNLPIGRKSGIDQFLFGQVAALGQRDIILMAVVTGLVIVVLGVGYKEFLITSFDAAFARAAGFPTRLLHHTLMLLLAFAIVIALQAVGVVLVSAMLITPAAAAYLLTDRMHHMLWVAVLFGVVAGALGAFFSFVGTNFSTGPWMVLAASTVFLFAYLFGPRHGVVTRWFRRRSTADRFRRENLLKAMYHVLEAREFEGDDIPLAALAERRRTTLDEITRGAAELRRHQFATLNASGDVAYFTPAGWQRACEIVRNHRLWELYLTNAANFAADHVHDDAERIEHLLGDDTVRALERSLNHARRDPHGRLIPGLADIRRGIGLGDTARPG